MPQKRDPLQYLSHSYYTEMYGSVFLYRSIYYCVLSPFPIGEVSVIFIINLTNYNIRMYLCCIAF